jgi:uncharacterized protein (UPF0276 family)
VSPPPAAVQAPAAGLGLKPVHYADALACAAAGDQAGLWFEVHPENYMVDGGPRLAWLAAIRERWPLSLHGVGLSLAGDERPDPVHLRRFRALIDRFDPFVVSEHLAWSRRGGVYHPDLLPVPRTGETLDLVARNLDIAQQALGRRLLIENPTHYLRTLPHAIDEVDFLAELARRTGCGLLVDVNNVHAGSVNTGFDPLAWLDRIPGELVGEIHLAGTRPDPELGETLLIDSHDTPVAEPVWDLYARLVARIGPRPTLIERDGDVPAFEALLAEQGRAARVLAAQGRLAA